MNTAAVLFFRRDLHILADDYLGKGQSGQMRTVAALFFHRDSQDVQGMPKLARRREDSWTLPSFSFFRRDLQDIGTSPNWQQRKRANGYCHLSRFAGTRRCRHIRNWTKSQARKR